MAKDKKRSLVFLIETKLKSRRVNFLKNKLGFEGCFVMDYVGRSGELMLMWRKELEIEIINISQRHISGWVGDET